MLFIMTKDSGLKQDGIWTEMVEVRSYQADAMRRATLESLCLYFQEAAWNHAEALGVGFSHLREQGRLWVLSRLALEIERPPQWGEVVKVLTWPRSAQMIYAMRDFEIRDARDERLAGGASAWLVLNEEARRPQRLDKFLSHVQGLPEKRALGGDPEKLPDSMPAAKGEDFRVNYSDMDANGHVNNSRYIRWISDSYSAAFHQAHRPRRLEINFLSETRAGDVLSVFTEETASGDFNHAVVKGDRAEPVCRARLSWK